MRTSVTAILLNQGIDPDQKVGERTAFQVLEAAVLGALEEIEDGQDGSPPEDPSDG